MLGAPTKLHCQALDQTLRFPAQACLSMAASGDGAPLGGDGWLSCHLGLLRWTWQPREDEITGFQILGHMHTDIWSTMQVSTTTGYSLPLPWLLGDRLCAGH